MTNRVKHLYIHIPFCKSICDYCDFDRCKASSNVHNKYIQLLIKKIKKINQKLDTIYIGGGTPNSLSNENIDKLFSSLKKNISKKTEFTVECNPEFISKEQVQIFKKNKVNRVSIGAQTTNNKVLRLMGRKHTINQVEKSIMILQNKNIKNISLDFIYGFNEIKQSDLKNAIEFIKKNKIKHVSFYSLEIKENSKLKKNKYKTNEEKIESELMFIQKELERKKFRRYEISNWAKSKKYFSKHNLAYWKTNDWIGIGYGSFGFENKIYYKTKGKILDWKKEATKLSQNDYDFQVLMMGLRLVQGINLKNSKNKQAYERFVNKLNQDKIWIKKNKLKVKKINLLNDLLVDIV